MREPIPAPPSATNDICASVSVLGAIIPRVAAIPLLTPGENHHGLLDILRKSHKFVKSVCSRPKQKSAEMDCGKKRPGAQFLFSFTEILSTVNIRTLDFYMCITAYVVRIAF